MLVEAGSLIDKLKGSHQSATYVVDRVGIIKQKKKYSPVVHQSFKTNKERTSQLTGYWKALSLPQIATWVALFNAMKAAQSTELFRPISVFNVFMQLNLNRMFLGDSLILTAPTYAVLTIPTASISSYSHAGAILNWMWSGYASSSYHLVLYASDAVRSSSIRKKIPMFYMTSVLGNSTNPLNIWSVYYGVIGHTPTVDSYIYFECYAQQVATGLRSKVCSFRQLC